MKHLQQNKTARFRGGSAIPETVFRIWQYREKIEHEAAHLFQSLAKDLRSTYGSGDPVAELSDQAASDEKRHAILCRQILDLSPDPLPPLAPQLNFQLGPRGLSTQQRATYTAVAMGCVTETFSTALLVEMRLRASHPMIKDTVHEILEDEILHGRVGWAEMARAAVRKDVWWICPYISMMIQAALETDIAPMLGPTEGSLDLSPYGILSAQESQRIMKQTLEGVVLPGLRSHGLPV